MHLEQYSALLWFSCTQKKGSRMQASGRPVRQNIVKSLRFALAILLSLAFVIPAAPAVAVPTSAEKQAEADAAYARLQAAESEAMAAAELYYTALDGHDAAVAVMEETQGLITEYEAQIADKQTSLSSRAATMYRKGQTSYLDVLLGARSFWEFISVWDLLNSINNQDAQLISEVKSLREKSQLAYIDYAAQEALAKRKLEEADAAKRILDEKAVEQQAVYDSLSAEVAELLAAEEDARKEAARKAEERANTQTQPQPQPGKPSAPPSYTDGGSSYSNVADVALTQVGKEYAWGATGPDAYDCSGLVVWAYRQCGLSAPPRSSEGMYAGANGIYPVSQAQRGDILYTYGHVGISLGGNDYVHASTYGVGVVVSYNASAAFDFVLRF
jgi:cell wall-associated NlpC family hydrolase